MNLEESFVLRNELVVVVVIVEALVLIVVELLFLHFWPRGCHNCLGPGVLQRGGGEGVKLKLKGGILVEELLGLTL